MKMHKLWMGVALFLVACSAETAVSTPTTATSTNIEPTNTVELPPTNTPPPSPTAAPTEEVVEEVTEEVAEVEVDPTTAPTPTEAGPTRTPNPELVERYAEYELITLLPPDAIPAIDDPQFLSLADANEVYDPGELIIGVEFNGDARAYSVPLLSNHEIVNDTVGGEKIAVTW